MELTVTIPVRFANEDETDIVVEQGVQGSDYWLNLNGDVLIPEGAVIRRSVGLVAECDYCQKWGHNGPPHFARAHCQSGKRNHCSCDSCF